MQQLGFTNRITATAPPSRAAALQRPLHCRVGFTLIEILIVVVILGILASIVIPQFASASHSARENTLKDDLRFLRTQIQVYKAQHRGVAPGYPGGDPNASPTQQDFIAQLTNCTDDKGNTSPTTSTTYKFGPYLSQMPPNPLSGSVALQMVANGGTMPAAADDSTGWVFQADSTEIRANSVGTDLTGNSYYQY